MPATQPATRPEGRGNLLWGLLTFERLITGPMVHIVYWCGLAFIALGGFGLIGAAVGVAIRAGSLEGVLLAVPLLVGGLIGLAASVLLWRGACEFYMAVMRIAEDLRAIRVGIAKNEPPAAPRATEISGGFDS